MAQCNFHELIQAYILLSAAYQQRDTHVYRPIPTQQESQTGTPILDGSNIEANLLVIPKVLHQVASFPLVSHIRLGGGVGQIGYT